MPPLDIAMPLLLLPSGEKETQLQTWLTYLKVGGIFGAAREFKFI